jgi:hypothetical protein
VITLHLTAAESAAYARVRELVRAEARRQALRLGRRFAQVVDVRGRIVDVLEVLRGD